jgi:hypothetical protein
VDRQTITYVWIGGAALALLVYFAGPDTFLSAVWGALDNLEAAFHAFLSFLGAQAFDVVRAAAIAVYIVFLILGFLALQRGRKAVGSLIFVTLCFLILVWRPDAASYVSSTRWLAALALGIIGAVVLTQRLLEPPRTPFPPPPGRPPYPGRP